MGSSESSLSTTSQRLEDEITTVSERSQGVDPILEKFKSLQIANPILTSQPPESSFTDILVRRSSASSNLGTVNPNVLLELFSTYREWQEKQAQKLSKIQAWDGFDLKQILGNPGPNYFFLSIYKIRVQVELGELKGRLTEVISTCDGLCKRIASEGPESLKSSVKPYAVASGDLETTSSPSSTQTSSKEAQLLLKSEP